MRIVTITALTAIVSVSACTESKQSNEPQAPPSDLGSSDNGSRAVDAQSRGESALQAAATARPEAGASPNADSPTDELAASEKSAGISSGRRYMTSRTQVRSRDISLCPDGHIESAVRSKRQSGTFERDGSRIDARFGKTQETYELSSDLMFLKLPGGGTLEYAGDAACAGDGGPAFSNGR